MFDLLSHVDRGFELYAAAEGVDLGSTGGLRSLDLGDTYDELQAFSEAQWAEDGGLTAYMVLRVISRLAAERCTVSAADLYLNQAEAMGATAAHRRLLAHVDDPRAVAEMEKFQNGLRDSAAAMGLLDHVEDQITDLDQLASIRRDALVSHRYLSVHTFRTGQPGSESVKFQRSIMKFWNVNSVIAAANVQPENAVTLCLIRDPVALWSYFAFIIRDGDIITLWTDVPETAHPLQKFGTRARADARRFNDRAFQLRFPYHLLEFEFDDDERFLAERAEGLVPINVTGVRVAEIDNLPADQALWLILMFNLIRDNPRHEARRISATGAGLVALPSARKQWSRSRTTVAQIPGTANLELLHAQDVSLSTLEGSAWDKPSTAQNQWMEDRYASKVPHQLYNLVARQGRDGSTLSVVKTLDGASYVPELPKVRVPGKAGHYNGGVIRETAALDPSTFGTPDELEKDRRWIARYNQANYILALAWEEFHERKDEITRWWQEHVLGNRERLLRAVASGSLIGEVQPIEPDDEPARRPFVRGRLANGARMPGPGELLDLPQGFSVTGNLLDRQLFSQGPAPPDEAYGRFWAGFQVDHLLETRRGDGDASHIGFYSYNDDLYPHFRCGVSGQAAKVWTLFKPRTAIGIAKLAGVEATDLPDVLRIWTAYKLYAGNPLVHRCDPLDTHADNPWKSLRFEVTIAVSLATYNRLRKEAGLRRRRRST